MAGFRLETVVHQLRRIVTVCILTLRIYWQSVSEFSFAMAIQAPCVFWKAGSKSVRTAVPVTSAVSKPLVVHATALLIYSQLRMIDLLLLFESTRMGPSTPSRTASSPGFVSTASPTLLVIECAIRAVALIDRGLIRGFFVHAAESSLLPLHLVASAPEIEYPTWVGLRMPSYRRKDSICTLAGSIALHAIAHFATLPSSCRPIGTVGFAVASDAGIQRIDVRSASLHSD